MKRAILALLLLSLMATVATAADVVPYTATKEMRATWTHAYAAADTIDGSKFRDTVYSPWVKIPAVSKFFFSLYVDGRHAGDLGAGIKDSAFALDSMNFNIQTTYADPQYIGNYAPDAGLMTTTNLGVLKHATSPADLDTTIAYAATLARDTVLMRANYVRAMIVVMDSAAAGTDRPSVLGNTYGRIITLFLNAKP